MDRGAFRKDIFIGCGCWKVSPTETTKDSFVIKVQTFFSSDATHSRIVVAARRSRELAETSFVANGPEKVTPELRIDANSSCREDLRPLDAKLPTRFTV